MENFFTRFRKETIVAGILLAQIILLAMQVQVTGNTTADPNQKITLIRSWAEAMVAPFQRATIHTGQALRAVWSDYVDLRDVREENEKLNAEVNRLRLEQARYQQDAAQGRRLQSLLEFKEQLITHTLAAQVIGTSGTDLSRVLYVDRGSNDGVMNGMAVVTPDGIVGKILHADSNRSQVLLINDVTSGAGVMLERQRIKGVLKGSNSGRPEIINVMADEKIEPGDKVITTGGDGVYPKGLSVGTVESVTPDKERDPFLLIRVKPAVNLPELEEVLIITEMAVRTPGAMETGSGSGTTRAADLLSLRLPSAKKKVDETSATIGTATVTPVVNPLVPKSTDGKITAIRPTTTTTTNIQTENKSNAAGTDKKKPTDPVTVPKKQTPDGRDSGH